MKKQLFLAVLGQLFTIALLAGPVLGQGPCCVVSDNGSGTADLPPGCPEGYLGSLRLVEGLPTGSTVEMEARLADVIVVSQQPGGSLGGTREEFTAMAHLEAQGTGTLSGFQRSLQVPVTGITDSGPRIFGAPVQAFAIRVVRLQGILTGDYDFALLWFEGGNYFGLDSPGSTTLTRQGGAGAGFSVASAFDFRYRIQFEGSPESFFIALERGITLDLEAPFALCASGATLAPAGPAAGLNLTAAPNPLSEATRLSFALSTDANVHLSVYDTRGRRVRTLMDGRRDQGRHDVRWDGRGEAGNRLPAGVYFARLTLNGGPRHGGSARVVRLSRLR